VGGKGSGQGWAGEKKDQAILLEEGASELGRSILYEDVVIAC